MNTKFLFAAVAVLVAAAVSVFVCVNNKKNAMDDFFNANVEALAESEIVVGNLCMVAKFYACGSLGEVYPDHYPA